MWVNELVANSQLEEALNDERCSVTPSPYMLRRGYLVPRSSMILENISDIIEVADDQLLQPVFSVLESLEEVARLNHEQLLGAIERHRQFSRAVANVLFKQRFKLYP